MIELKLDSIEDAENKIVELYRGGKKLLSHTLLKREGDCSSINIQLGNYVIKENKIIFYSYWATADRFPGTILPFGFMKQIYSVNSFGSVKLKNSYIYIWRPMLKTEMKIILKKRVDS